MTVGAAKRQFCTFGRLDNGCLKGFDRCDMNRFDFSFDFSFDRLQLNEKCISFFTVSLAILDTHSQSFLVVNSIIAVTYMQ